MTPSQDQARVRYHPGKKPLQGLDARVHDAIGAFHRRGAVLKSLKKRVDRVLESEAEWQRLSGERLRDSLAAFRETFRRNRRVTSEVVESALGAIREAADRELGLRAYPVQVMGALALHEGRLAEMATGEGKTLTAGLTAVLRGWTRLPCHVITVNDYLVERDTKWLEPFYRFCGVRVGRITAGMEPEDRRKGYAGDVTYGTSKEMLADFLRDRLRLGLLSDPKRRLIRQMLRSGRQAGEGLVMRGLHSVIVDEADSVLIDEAVTPLIISSPRQNELFKEAYGAAQEVIQGLEPETDYLCNLRYREIELTKSGNKKIEEASALRGGIWQGPGRRMELIKQALAAHEFFRRGRQYIIEDGRIVIVDEFTGRPMPNRSWRQGMQQAIEAKEGLSLSDPSETVARLSFQRFFRSYCHLAGMTGTAREAAGELWQIYRLPVVAIPTNRPCLRRQWPTRFYASERRKWEAVVEAVEEVHQSRRPILIGTRSVAASEHLGNLLRARGLEFQILNASRLYEEAMIIQEAGRAGRITIATNMAGRGTDIKLGGRVVEMGGLHVIATELHESVRVDRQLFGRSARQGDPGSAQAFASADDELFRKCLPASLHRVIKRSLGRRYPGNETLLRVAASIAQSRAQRLAARQRVSVLRMDSWLDEALSFAGGNRHV